MKITIQQAKAFRETLGAKQLVVVAVSEDGSTCVATHGLTTKDSREAAKGGNLLKKYLGWPDEMCHDSPLPRICKNCVFFKPDYGMWCFNGWSGDGSRGHCLVEPATVRVAADHGCRLFEPNA